ncbi:hypothetical protein BT96DRAFT_813031 [Gymnopus androsaceus JB14]|uniref:Uncharacterized protein n=1 Tax=Gymnopus androsaceus JB14 TaxID=1447944 RepID=A0A6A4I295_9AGAR|nr:hypothetical protein BT96DRAFT_813031 [Gymnopus androsaceus JB14]
MPGAETIAPANFPGRLVKSFPTVQAAKSTYQECLQTGVLGLLAQEDTKTTVYIVTKGFEPGVYASRKNALKYGLNWRGGEVTCTDGTVIQAKAIFELWRSLGHVTHLRWDRKFVVDAILSEAV